MTERNVPRSGPEALSTVDDYLETVDGADRAVLARGYAIAREVVPEAEQGTSYGMPALVYRGKGLFSTLRAKKFLSLYPYSGAVLAGLAEELADFETTTGSVHYSAERPVPDDLLRRIVQRRRDEIDARAR